MVHKTREEIINFRTRSSSQSVEVPTPPPAEMNSAAARTRRLQRMNCVHDALRLAGTYDGCGQDEAKRRRQQNTKTQLIERHAFFRPANSSPFHGCFLFPSPACTFSLLTCCKTWPGTSVPWRLAPGCSCHCLRRHTPRSPLRWCCGARPSRYGRKTFRAWGRTFCERQKDRKRQNDRKGRESTRGKERVSWGILRSVGTMWC